ncbi:MAG: efflux RND transporter periplasmic adaptor subunit [Hyphomicrobiales bacterium]
MPIPISYLIAAGLTAGVAGWMLSGDIIEGGRSDARPATITERLDKKETKLFRVQAEIFNATQHISTIEVRGSTEARDKVAIRSEMTGLLNTRHVKKGDSVAQGDLICTLNVGAREAMVHQRTAELEKAKIDYTSAQKLIKGGFATKSRVIQDKALVDAATAAMKAAEIELEHTQIRAPIDGVIQDPFANVGDMLQVGDICANIMRPDTMNMIAEVSERFIGRIHVGDEAHVHTVTGEAVTGEIIFISPSANIETRTFRIEIAVPNSDNKIRDGVTAVAKIDLPGDTAHFIPASALTLNDAGQLGARTVGTDGIVSFIPVTILNDTRDGMWVAGLPDTAKIITRGQEYVATGQKVEAVLKTAKVSQ